MEAQRSLFDDDDDDRPPLPPTDPNAQPEDHRRLTGQNEVILARLQQGPATNVELADLSLKYTSRISDLRAAGYKITCDRVRRANAIFNGLTVYTLEQVRNHP